jgi:hypothetical protein
MINVLTIKKVPYGLIERGQEVMRFLFEAYQPRILLIENIDYPGSRRSRYLPMLITAIKVLARRRGIVVIEYTPREVREALSPADTRLTKAALCAAIARHYPQLAHCLPKKPRGIGATEPHYTVLFMAVALGLTWYKKSRSRT